MTRKGTVENNGHEIAVVDHGRGLQLSTSRITVQDLVPYFQDGCSDEEIIRCIPILSAKEIAVVKRYYEEHKEELDEQDRCIRERTARRKNPPGVEELLARAGEKMAVLRQEFQKRKKGTGAGA